MDIKDLYNSIPSCYNTEEEKAAALILAAEFDKGIESGVIHFDKFLTKKLMTIPNILQEIYDSHMIVLWSKEMKDERIGVVYFDENDFRPFGASVPMPLDKKEFILRNMQEDKSEE